MREKAGKPGDTQQRQREIFYDTDHIFERQKETIRICRDCGGSLEINSRASTKSNILAVHIPFNACKACIETGYDMFDRADKNQFDKVILQDRPQRQLHHKIGKKITLSSLLEKRALIIRAVRDFFTENGFLEVETPLRIPRAHTGSTH